MDPIIVLDEEGDGHIIFYAWGNSYKAEVTDWKVDSLELAEQFDPKAHAQKMVNRHYANLKSSQVGGG